MNNLPLEIENKIWNRFWESIYYTNVINEFKQINKNNRILLEFQNSKDFLIINSSKLHKFKEINNLIKSCLNNTSFKLITPFRFFKNKKSNKLFDKFDESIRYTSEFIFFFSNYMAYKVYYELQYLTTQ